jgi:heptaprenyl diphosphate synthase/octaprenyl-diphosphate synthase
MERLNLFELLAMPDLDRDLSRLDRYIRSVVPENELAQPITRLLAQPGKQLRASLLLAVIRSQGKPIGRRALASCAAIELLHLGSLVHDDIIDQSPTRRDIPTVHAHEGMSSAILVGDYLFALANMQAALVSQSVAGVVAGAMAQLAEGESLELSDRNNANRSRDSYFRAISGKTAALFSAACEVGGLCAGLPKRQVDSIKDYGHEFGMSFQLIDDLNDIVDDIQQGMYTLPVLLALSYGISLKDISPELLRQQGFVDQTITAVYSHNQAASQALRGRTEWQRLADFPNAYLQWAQKSAGAAIRL